MKEVLDRLLSRHDLSGPEAAEVMRALASGTVPDALAGALLIALRAKGETAEEVAGLADAMAALALRPDFDPQDVQAGLIDIVGTGGDASGSYNLSTGAALLSAACGLKVAKHGNRSISSRCGSADVLEAIGLTLPADAHAAARCLRETGFTFLFAPHFHPATARLAPVRRALGVRTVFNLLGPLSNPARPRFGVFGAFSPEAGELMARALARMPIERAFVVHGAHGWDEPTPVGPFELWDVRPNTVEYSRRDPHAYGLARCAVADLMGGDARLNAQAIRDALTGTHAALRDALVLGAALALEVSGSARDGAAGAAIAQQAIESGAARRMLDAIAAFGASTAAGSGSHTARQSGEVRA